MQKYQIKAGLDYFQPASDSSEQTCVICLQTLGHKTTFGKLRNCSDHFFHRDCITLLKADKQFVKCPVCQLIYGVYTGDQPPGKMTKTIIDQKCSGYDCKTIAITYNMSSFTKNKIYYNSTVRTAYLPDNQEGRRIYKLLEKAFQRRLIFTLGRSITTGLDNQIIWAGIHHKSNLSGGSTNFGYPDPTYFKRVREQLAIRNIFE